MKKTQSSVLLITLLSITTSAFAFGSRDEWESGYAQGTAEYTILGPGQSQLYLACDSSGYSPEKLIFTDPQGREISSDNGQRVFIKIDSRDAADVSETDSHAGSENFAWMWDKLRTGKRVTVSGEGVKSTTFTLKNAAHVLPTYNDSGCVSNFVR
ncbi:MAG: hypothetical protein ACRC2W_14755 [Plesiomonas shigelloides]